MSDELKAWRKKPVVIGAVQVTDEWFDGPHPNPLHIAGEAIVTDPKRRAVFIQTLEGTMRADVGDYIVRGVKGEFYPCKPDIFAATYEPADTPTRPSISEEKIEEMAREIVTTGPLLIVNSQVEQLQIKTTAAILRKHLIGEVKDPVGPPKVVAAQLVLVRMFDSSNVVLDPLGRVPGETLLKALDEIGARVGDEVVILRRADYEQLLKK